MPFGTEGQLLSNFRFAVRRQRETRGAIPEYLKSFVAQFTDSVLLTNVSSDQIVAGNQAACQFLGVDQATLCAIAISDLLPEISIIVGTKEPETACKLPISAGSTTSALVDVRVSVLPVNIGKTLLHLIVIKPAAQASQQAETDSEPGNARNVEQLGAVLETAWQISLLQDIDQLASSTAKILNERFNYYHVRVYLTDDSGMAVAAEVGDDNVDVTSVADVMVNEAADLKNMVLRDRVGSPMTAQLLERSVDLAQVAVPVAAFGEICGVIYIQCGLESHVTAEDRETVSAIARQLAVGITNIRLREETGEKATNDERRRLAREIHDSVAGDLAALLWQMEDLVAQLTSGTSISVDRIKEIRSATREVLAESRRAVSNLRSETIGDCPLSQLLEAELDSLEKISGISTRYSGNYSGVGLRQEAEFTLLRIGQEAISNARRHSGASHISVSLSRTGNEVTLVVEDDGRGFTASQPVGSESVGFGLTSMQERAFSIGADLKVNSVVGEGTRIEVVVESVFE